MSISGARFCSSQCFWRAGCACWPVTIVRDLDKGIDGAVVYDQTEAGDFFGEEMTWARPGLGDAVSRLAVSTPTVPSGG